MARFILLLAAMSGFLMAKTAEVDGKRVYYEVSGRGARTLVLIHGWTCDHTFWEAQLPALDREYKVLAVDLPGHGRSEAHADYPMSLFARAVEAVLAKEKTPKATLIGHSMGGAVMLEFSRRFPEKLQAVVLVDSFMAGPEIQAPEKFIDSLQGPGGAEARRKMVEGMFSAATTPEAREKILKVMLAAPESLAVNAMRNMFSKETWREGRAQAPALAVVAHPEQIREEALRQRWPELTYRSMPGTGHFLMMEKPAEFNAILLEWLRTHGS